MTFWQAIILILKNWGTVLQFLNIIENAIQKGYDHLDLKKSLDRIDKGFSNDKTAADSAASATQLNDAFRRKL